MLERVDRTYTKDEVMGLMEPLISTWFNERFDDLTIPQAKAIPVIHQRRNVLVSSPTGSGKTLTAFTSIINELTRYSREGTLEERVYCIYVSPLKALANDVNRNLNTPLAEMREVAAAHGMDIPDIRVAVRSGDTPQSERQRMVRHPPHILITTPESLALILAAPKFREAFKKVEWVILDEIHDICDSKRGAFLSLTLERLRHHCDNDFVRIGLSATLAPIEAIAGYLVGCEPNGDVRDVVLIESGSKKQLDLKVICPTDDMTTLSSDIVNSMMYDTLKDLIDQHETTLVFTNTRSGAESVVYKLKERGLENIEVHHSSLGKEIRLDVEERLKRGEIKCVVSSTSLELGIDIGSVDLVCQIGSPKSVAKGLQRIGRSGHSFGKVAKGRLLVFDPDDLVECAVMCRAAHRGDIDRVGIPENCLDVLSQTVVGMSLDSRWDAKEAYELVKGSYCYRNLPEESFLDVLKYLGSKDDFEGVYSKIWYDEEEGQFGKKKGSRMIYFMNLGTIPEEANYRVVTNHGSTAGELSEKFVERLSPRDVFVLGGRSFEFVRSKGMTAYVKEANGRKPTVPSWAGEMLPRSFDLSMDIAEFRKEMASRIDEPDAQAISELVSDFDVDEGSARSILSYFREQEAVAGFIPDCDRLAVEEYIDPSGNQKLVFHFPFGRRVNDALSRAYAYRMTGMIGANVSVTISDDSFMLGCPRKFDLAQIPGLIRAGELEQVLRRSIKDSEIFKLRFRHTAARSFMILRNYMGRPISVNRQQIRSTYLLEMLGDMERVPVIEETYREVLEDDMDIRNAQLVLDMIDSGRMGLELIHYTGTPSPFAHSAILSGFSDIVLMEDRSALLRELHRKVLYRALGDSVSEFEFTEDQVIPYFAQKPPRIMSKSDIPKLLAVTGPLQAMRERGRNIYSYSDEDKKTLDGWVRELIREGVIGTVFLDETHIMNIEEVPYYAAATRRERELNDTDRAVYDRIGQNTAMSEITAELEVSEDVTFRSVRKLESMYLITRTDVTGNNRWFFSRVRYPEVDRRRAVDRIVLRYLECFAPATVQEVAFALSVSDEDARASLESLVAAEEVAKGRFLISEDDQYMLKIDHMRLKAGRDNVYDYETVERYRLTKGESFDSIRDFFEFYGSAGSELDVYTRVKGFDLSEWYSMRESGELLLGRFVRGRVRYVLRDEGDRYAALRHEEVTDTDRRVLNMIDGMERATMRQLVAATGMEKDDVKESIMRLDRSLLVIRDFDEREDWGTENTYAVYRPGDPGDEPARALVRRAVRAYGPIPVASMRYLVDIPLDEIERLAAEEGAATISVGEGQVPMLVMKDELPALERVPEQEFPVRVLSLYDPDLGLGGDLIPLRRQVDLPAGPRRHRGRRPGAVGDVRMHRGPRHGPGLAGAALRGAGRHRRDDGLLQDEGHGHRAHPRDPQHRRGEAGRVHGEGPGITRLPLRERVLRQGKVRALDHVRAGDAQLRVREAARPEEREVPDRIGGDGVPRVHTRGPGADGPRGREDHHEEADGARRHREDGPVPGVRGVHDHGHGPGLQGGEGLRARKARQGPAEADIQEAARHQEGDRDGLAVLPGDHIRAAVGALQGVSALSGRRRAVQHRAGQRHGQARGPEGAGPHALPRLRNVLGGDPVPVRRGQDGGDQDDTEGAGGRWLPEQGLPRQGRPHAVLDPVRGRGRQAVQGPGQLRAELPGQPAHLPAQHDQGGDRRRRQLRDIQRNPHRGQLQGQGLRLRGEGGGVPGLGQGGQDPQGGGPVRGRQPGDPETARRR